MTELPCRLFTSLRCLDAGGIQDEGERWRKALPTYYPRPVVLSRLLVVGPSRSCRPSHQSPTKGRLQGRKCLVVPFKPWCCAAVFRTLGEQAPWLQCRGCKGPTQTLSQGMTMF
ncbi:hypothetical protein BAUCODRAFT_219843 [Baudoinia panamericana UAMH 10762]|uniref:Uncharacterized protein n=1 Tax=Baudoinia panamericana (strain UAMH 10762) TaxID=717646 RepID=M2N4X1_BAUPA|nr:uncharacterized protein BAUCODRAFT_219843 [Baudoinia panamericana UAMH 10762]EMC94064.1 hypothetical protein BAUCODRAFT_219843 [Baudoinia panamericana UAMH 10762]